MGSGMARRAPHNVMAWAMLTSCHMHTHTHTHTHNNDHNCGDTETGLQQYAEIMINMTHRTHGVITEGRGIPLLLELLLPRDS